MPDGTAPGYRALRRHLRAVPDVDSPDPFEDLATLLLQRTVLLVEGREHRLEEIEFYYHAPSHPDPFAHCHPAQRNTAKWYFHRTGSGYRGGTYKGVDITFAPPEQFGGILIRTLRTPEGEWINGSSSCVEHLLTATGHPTVASLDEALRDHAIDDPRSPLALRPASSPDTRPIWRSARVGLTLKRAERFPAMEDYILRPYRFVRASRAIKKGRPQLVLALARRGHAPRRIAELTGTPRHTIESHLKAYAEGRRAGLPAKLRGRALSTRELCWLQGALDARDSSSRSI